LAQAAGLPSARAARRAALAVRGPGAPVRPSAPPPRVSRSGRYRAGVSWAGIAPATSARSAMAPKKAPAKEEVVEEDGKEDEKGPIWVYGANDHLDIPKELPSGFKTTGFLRIDYMKLCKAVGASPHPALRPKPKVVPPPVPERGRRPSTVMETVPTGPPPITEGSNLTLRSMLVDSTSVQLLGLLLPTATQVKVLSFSDCRLDVDMLALIRKGLVTPCTVESLQIEWNPLELPLPSVEEMEALAAASISEEEAAEAADGVAPGLPESVGEVVSNAAPFGDSSNLEVRERRRYFLQSQRTLINFGDWLSAIAGSDGLAGIWSQLAQTGIDSTLLNSSDFYDALETHLGMSGPQVAEVFEVLDGPDFGGGQGRYSFADLRAALEGLPEEPTDAAVPADAIGASLATFLDGDCVLESISLRSCSFGRLELGPMSAALAKCPWQLRSLNFWENRICDRGAKLLADALGEYRGLEYLGLGRNRITDTGFTTLCMPFHSKVLDEAGMKEAKDAIKGQEVRRDAAAKAKAKAKANTSGARERRQPPLVVDDLEEGPEGEDGAATWVLRKPCDLKTMVFSENPIRNVSTLETVQPHGPRGAELLLKNTQAGAALLAKRPELAEKKESKQQEGRGQSVPGAPGGEGWVLRLV